MLGPIKVADFLTPSEASFMPKPVLEDPTVDVELEDVPKAIIKSIHESNVQAMDKFYESVLTLFNSFYDGVAKASLNFDNKLTFGLRLAGHVDGTLVELARQKLLSVFKGKARG